MKSSRSVRTRAARPSDVASPSLRAIAATFSGPRSRVRRAYTVLSDLSVACEIGIRPEYVCSYVATCQPPGPVNGAER